MNIVTISAVCIVMAAVSSIFKQYNKEYSVFIAIVCSCGVLFVSISTLAPIIDDIANIANTTQVGEYVSVMFKGLGICYISSFASSICSDCGEKAISDKVELGAKIAIASLYVPIMLNMIETVLDIIKL